MKAKGPPCIARAYVTFGVSNSNDVTNVRRPNRFEQAFNTLRMLHLVKGARGGKGGQY